MDILSWLFSTREGVIILFVGGIAVCLLIAFILERKTSKMYYNHEKAEGEEDSLFDGLFGDDDE
jgi:hypothetical protein